MAQPQNGEADKKAEIAMYIASSFSSLYPAFTATLIREFPQIRASFSQYDDHMPLPVVGRAERLIALLALTGSTWAKALLNIYDLGYFTQENTAVEPNVDDLVIFAPVFETRKDDNDFKVDPEDPDKNLAVVPAVPSFTKPLAEMVARVARTKTLVTLDLHSHKFVNQLKELGVEVINLTAAFELYDELEKRGLLKPNLENVFVGVDFGNLPLILKLKKVLKIPITLIALIWKIRHPVSKEGKTRTEHKLIWGDVKGKRALVFDDVASSGGTLLTMAKLLIAEGAKEVLICAIHPVFAGRDYYKTLCELLAIPQVKVVMTTDSIPLQRPEESSGQRDDKDLPYVKIPGEIEGQSELREVIMHPIEPFVGVIIQALMTTRTAEEIKKILEKYIVELRDPDQIIFELTGQEFKNLVDPKTGKKLHKPEVTAVYREGGLYEPLPPSASDPLPWPFSPETLQDSAE
ncbi:MAG TPA: hypothetical protein DEP87_01315 [Candidatus Pacebacteria bacterium]|nr:hypothetical protein [Candidatus Paceibacterota bacterium]